MEPENTNDIGPSLNVDLELPSPMSSCVQEEIVQVQSHDSMTTSPRTTLGISVLERPTTTASRERAKVLNKYELLIAPNEHSIVDNALLKCTPYIINIKYMVLICADCMHAVNPDRASEHLHKNHPHCKVQKKLSTLIRSQFPALVCEAIRPLDIVEPIFGLAIPMEEYTICARCRRGYANISTWERHVCRNADDDLKGQPEHFSSFVQTFFLGPRICYFPVQLPSRVSESVEGQDDDFELFKSGFQDLVVSNSEEVEEPDDYRQLNQFLFKEGWIDHLKGHSQPELSFLTTPPKEGEVLKPLARDTISLMLNIQNTIGTAGYHVRRLLGKRPTYVCLLFFFFLVTPK